MILLLLQYGPAFVGLLLAVAMWFISRRHSLALPLAARLSTVSGMLIVLASLISFNAWSIFPTWIPPLGEDRFLLLALGRFVFPLLLCAVALLFLIAPTRAPRPQGSAELARRTLMSFAPRRWLICAGAVTGAVIVISVLAGLASSPDESGRYVMYGFDASATTGAKTTIYGWWFSLPCLALIAIIVAIALIELAVISHPPLAVDRQRDIEMRTARVRGVLAVATGGLLLHLATVLQSLYGTSTLRLTLQGGQAGLVSLGTSFAAIGPFLLVASYVAFVVGIATWWWVLLSTFPAGSKQPRESGAKQPRESART